MDQEVRSPVISPWIKEMRLGNESALYWAHVALDNGIARSPGWHQRSAVVEVQQPALLCVYRETFFV